MVKSKIKTFIGFSIKANKVAIGMNSIEALKKGVYAIIVCSTISENSFNFARKYAEKFGCPLIVCKCGLENVVYKQGCKMIAIKDRELGKAIINNTDEEFEIYVGGNS